MKRFYYYLHTNGELIGKPPICVESEPSYFDSPFVKRVWEIDLEDRFDVWKLIIEALGLEANIERVKELVDKWKLTEKDLPNFICRLTQPNQLQKDGMNKFISLILGKEPQKFWDSLVANKAKGGEKK